MKQLIKIGNVVDDGTGDYLRKGGQKINENFDEIYTKLGDGDTPHASGAWKTHTDAVLQPKFGDAWAINTTNNPVRVELPKGSVADYNKTLKLRDVWHTWSVNNVTLRPAQGDTIKGSPEDRILIKDFMDVELVYCAPGRWEYVENKRVDSITTSDLSTVAKKTFIVSEEGQTDFINIFGNDVYNISNLEVYYRGNLLYYGDDLTDDSNYGSVGNDGQHIVPLDGRTVRLRFPCNVGDTVQFVTYMDGIASFRSSYSSKTLRVYDTKDTDLVSKEGELWVGELSTKKTFSLHDFGIGKTELINPTSFEMMLNGRQLVRAGHADYPEFSCEGADATTREKCIELNGRWVESGEDFSLITNENGAVVEIKIAQPLESGDVIFIRWFNNDIGTLLEWDGEDGIREKANRVFLNSERVVNLTKRVIYEDYNNPSQKTMRPIPEAFTDRISDISRLFDIIYPIGTIYENAHNPANPAEYMGLGIWVRYAEGRFLAGWNSDSSDPHFALNNNDLDSGNNPSHSAGGTGGSVSQQIKADMIPELSTKEKVLVKDDKGSIIIGGCQVDPDAEGPAFTKYREDVVKVNDGSINPSLFSTIPPFTTVHRWVRVG